MFSSIQLINIIFLSIFLYINILIILKDISIKKINNKLLLCLFLFLPFYFFYSIKTWIIWEFEWSNIILSITLSSIISFLLYLYHIWGAGDAKYLLVLSLYIPYISILYIIGNIALLTILSLFLYLIFFYILKVTLDFASIQHHIKSILLHIYDSSKSSLRGFFHNKSNLEKFYFVCKWIITFWVLFISIRILRIILFYEIFSVEWYFHDSIFWTHISLWFLLIGFFIFFYLGYKTIKR